MKKITLLLVILLSSNLYSQDEELFKTWYLHSWDDDFNENIDISTVEPPITPTLIINEDFSYSGEAACNTFTGQIEYVMGAGDSEMLSIITFSSSEEECDYQIHTDFENQYFSCFLPIADYIITYDEDNLSLVTLVSAMHFKSTPLSSAENNIKAFSIYPNPVNDKLFIDTTDEVGGAFINIYSISGKELLTTSFVSELDVSGFKSGLYFLEIRTPQGEKQLQRFIKK